MMNRSMSWKILCLSLPVLAGCADRYRMQAPAGPQAKLDLPRQAAPKTWPMAAPPGEGVQQAGFLRPGGMPAAVGNSAMGRPPVRPELPAEMATATGFARVELITRIAAEKAADLDCYYVRLRRREVVDGRALPEDLALLKFRAQPYSVYLKALEGSPTEGREIVYVSGKYNDMLQIRTGKADILSGIRMELSPTAPRATQNTRRTLLEAGFPSTVDRFVREVQRDREQQTGLFTALGPQQREEYSQPMEVIRQVIPPGKEKHLPGGGERFWYFALDPAQEDYGLPMLIRTLDETQREVEYYAHDRLVLNICLTDDDFNPEVLWNGSK